MANEKYSPVWENDHDENHTLLPQTEQPLRREPLAPRSRLLHYIIPSILLISAVSLLTFQRPLCQHGGISRSWSSVGPVDETILPGSVLQHTKVELEAHIMSKCPDARDCLQQLVVPTMEQVSDMVNFKLSYIGSLDPQSDNVSCMHGPSECLGNIIQLCAQQVYPDPKLYLGFANCMTSDYRNIPERELIEGCAMEHGLDFDRLNECISDEGHGSELLRKSVEWSAQNHIRKSCTVRLNGNIRCIRDGGEWYDCPGGSDVSDLVSQIKSLYNGSI